MARFIFNQEVKHERNIYQNGDIASIPDDLADYFASNGWGYIEGQDQYNGEPILNPDIEPSPPIDIELEIDNSVLGTVDSNNSNNHGEYPIVDGEVQ